MKHSDFVGRVTVDIATRMVGDQEDIYIVQPGRRYWLYEHFRRSRHIFLEFPGLDLEFSSPAPDDRVLRQMVVRSVAISDWLQDDKTGPQPADDLNAYIGKDKRKRLGRYVGAIKRLYWDMEPGTIIVVPGPNYYDEVLIGEIVGKPKMLRNEAIYPGYATPARKIEWLRSKPRAAFSRDVREKFGTPNPIMQLDRSLRKEILRAGYDQYAFENEFTARLNTSEDEFSSLDDYNIQTFVNYVSGVLLALEGGQTTEISFLDAIDRLRRDPDAAPELKLNINSIGFQRLIDQTVKPLVIAALLSAALSANAGAQLAPPTIAISNTVAAGGDECTIMVSEKVEGALKLMRLQDWKMVCEAARDAHNATGLSTTMRAE
ncbi:hypothetical protein [Blastomonas sp.]|uniref:hypothetical protein n=1 Tax=Blastomonas sp. TaxID=1909299 RepID=UPI002622ACC1|nr:hypothetical protein [Blastomonas sp.]MDM7956003.1 hypothetical protein [Blastomonas sp.]